MCGRIGPLFAAIVVARQLRSLSVDHDTTDGHVAVQRSSIGLLQCLQHPVQVLFIAARNSAIGHAPTLTWAGACFPLWSDVFGVWPPLARRTAAGELARTRSGWLRGA